MNILLTGATGFIGRSLLRKLRQEGFGVSVTVRSKSNLFDDNVKQFVVGDLAHDVDWLAVLKNINCVIHLAGKAHDKNLENGVGLSEFYNINTKQTLKLARASSDAGVSRFIFLSSIGVNGSSTTVPFTEKDLPNPIGEYAHSKHRAELGLLDIASATKMEVVIIRPPLVYGANAPGNFGRLLKWAALKFPIPLPLGRIDNSRSLLSIDNLIGFILVCILHKKAANEVFLISDDVDLSTSDFLHALKLAFGYKAWLFPMPRIVMTFGAKLIRKELDVFRLFSSLEIDITKSKRQLGWTSKVTMAQSLKKVVDETNI